MRGGRGAAPNISRGFLRPPGPVLVAPRRGRERTATLAPQKRKGGMSGSGQLKRPKAPTSTPIPPGRLCRLCGKGDFAVVNLEKKPEIVVKVRELLNIR